MAVPGIPQIVSFICNTVIWNPVDEATSYNLYYKKDKTPNEYFSDNLNNWSVTLQDDNQTAEINNEQLLLVVPNNSGTITVVYDYTLQASDFDVQIDIPDYSPNKDTGNDGMNVGLRIYNEAVTNSFLRVGFFQDTKTNFRFSGYAQINGVVVKNYWTDWVPPYPSKIRIKRVGTVFTYYGYKNGWQTITTYDAEGNAGIFNTIVLKAFQRNTYGGSIRWDNLIITPSVYSYDIAITDIIDTRYTFVDLSVDDFYCIEVVAVNDDGEGTKSLEANATIEEFGYYTLQEINELYTVTESNLYTLQEIDGIYILDKIDVSIKADEMDTLYSVIEITQLYSTTALAET